jgi:hypothetical protein
MASIISSDSFTSSALAQNKVTVKHYVSTKTQLSKGNEILTFDAGTDIDAIFHLSISSYKNDKAGDVITSDGYIMIGPNVSIKKNDLIEFESVKYILFNVRKRGPSGDTHFYTYAQFNLYED